VAADTFAVVNDEAVVSCVSAQGDSCKKVSSKR
jgi:hypothetical protein